MINTKKGQLKKYGAAYETDLDIDFSTICRGFKVKVIDIYNFEDFVPIKGSVLYNCHLDSQCTIQPWVDNNNWSYEEWLANYSML